MKWFSKSKATSPADIPAEKAEPLHPKGRDQEQGTPVLVHVTAPSDLPAGYTFQASVNGDHSRVFTAEVVSVVVPSN